MNINAHYKKTNILNLLVGLYFISTAIFMDVGQPQFWASIAAVIILPTLVVRMEKHEKVDFRAKRKEVFRKKPS